MSTVKEMSTSVPIPSQKMRTSVGGEASSSKLRLEALSRPAELAVTASSSNSLDVEQRALRMVPQMWSERHVHSHLAPHFQDASTQTTAIQTDQRIHPTVTLASAADEWSTKSSLSASEKLGQVTELLRQGEPPYRRMSKMFIANKRLALDLLSA